MCRRFTLLTDLSIVIDAFGIEEVACDYRQGGNFSPGQEVAAVIHDRGRNRLVGFRWGLIPSWAKDPAIGNRMYNARAETITEKPSFARAFQKRRCLIPADGFYEWQKSGKTRQPLCFSLASGQPFGFAGLYETWMPPGKGPVSTCTIITTEANEMIRPIHDRMPVIVPTDMEAFWIDPDSHQEKELLLILKPYPSAEMRMSAGDATLFDGRKGLTERLNDL